jgi:CRISPR-associated protein Cmr1
MKTLLKPAPTRAELPARRERTALGDAGQPLVEIRVKLETSTTVMGGSTRPRVVDKAEVIRAASVRGALRFWWRALHGHQYKTPRELFEAEAALWGRAAEEGKQGRSAVEVRITLLDKLEDIIRKHLEDGDFKAHQVEEGYAIWTATSQKDGTPPAERYTSGIAFELRVKTPKDRAEEVRRTVKAWILFGGYGARTRRGVGSLTVRGEDSVEWLPTACTKDVLNEHLGLKLFGASSSPRRDTASLCGAKLYLGKTSPSARSAWLEAVNWLRDFRQSAGSGGEYARGAKTGTKPGRSCWPEPDKVRIVTGAWVKDRHEHIIDKSKAVVWPRAGFGLPIVGKFIDKGDPGPYTIIWYDRDGKEKDRLASPLIVKAMPLANGKFVSIALWLNRGFPDGQVGLKESREVPDGELTLAPFDKLVADGDTARYSPLNGITGTDQLQQAFFKWLEVKNYASEVR